MKTQAALSRFEKSFPVIEKSECEASCFNLSRPSPLHKFLVHPTEACAEHSGKFFEYCHIQNENLQCARTLSGTTNRVAFSTLKVHCLSASQHGSVRQLLAGKKRRGPQSIGDLLIGLLIRLGVNQENTVESKPSEALKP
ncbi:hypothetical protein [Allorhodopirellula solitaria]|uniref:Uncharacterized protein n=1 Tax=Allorhodopirellula solitaria TaxID=2527987 RepID=A0A5C5XQ77_9BACT|nr:hypothetical protein [Allorhodopirellula solitaria]TWT64563.1 hypothetical protein CA85_36960 [Allorhodopirellula solitaria]